MSDVKDKLVNFGWIKPEYKDKIYLELPLLAYQGFHGLPITGKLDSVTERHLEIPRFCGYPDVMEMAATVCKWNKKDIYWFVKGKLNSVTDNAFREAFKLAFSYWKNVCNINPIEGNASRADIIADAGNIDGRFSVLAWSEMPCGNQRPLNQKYDTSEPWVISDTMGNGQIDLVRVIAHELGHAIGIPHISSGNLMQPTVDSNIRKPQQGDIREAVTRYGELIDVPPVDPPEDPTPDSNVCVKLLKDLLGDLLKTNEGRKFTREAIHSVVLAVRDSRK